MRFGDRTVHTYREYLRAIIDQRDLLQTDIARRVGRSPAWLSQILNGKRRLHPDLAEELAEALDLEPKARLELLTLVEAEVGNSSLIRARAEQLQTGLEKPDLETVTARPLQERLVDWHVGAIFEMAGCVDYVPEPSWVAAAMRPRLTERDARAAMDLLREHGCLDDEYRRIEGQTLDLGTPRQGEDGEIAVRMLDYHRTTLDMARRALGVNANDRRFFGASAALSEQDYERLMPRLQEIVLQTLLSTSTEPPNRVVHVNLAVYPISLYTDSHVDPRTLDDEDP